MHNIPSVRLIENPFAAFAFMTAIACGAVAHAVSKRSELMAMLAVGLGFITISLTPTGFFGAAASSLLAIGTAVLAVRMGWQALSLTGLVASYACYGIIAGPVASAEQSPIQLCGLVSAYLVPYWLSNMWTTLQLKEDSKSSVSLTVGLLNSIAFLSMWLPSAGKVFPDAEVYLAMGALHLAAAKFCHARKQSALATLYTLTGLGLATLFIPIRLNHDCTVLSLGIETAVLVGLGLRYNVRSFRWYAIALSAVGLSACLWELGIYGSVHHSTQLFPIVCQWSVIAAWVTSLFMYMLPRFESVTSKAEKDFAFYSLLSSASIVAAAIPVAWFNSDAFTTAHLYELSVALVWGLEALAGVLVAQRLNRIYPAVLATFGQLLASVYAANCAYPDSPLAYAASACAIYAAPAFCSYWRKNGQSWFSALFYVQFFIASLATCAFIHAHASAAAAPLFLSAHAFLILLGGTLKNDTGLKTISLLLSVISMRTVFFGADSWTSILTVAGMSYSSGFLYASKPNPDTAETGVRNVFYCAATSLIAIFAARDLPIGWVSCAWSAHAALLLGFGFKLNDKFLRISGLTLFSVMIGKLLLFDLASAETIHRICAFLVAGVALLLSSFAYNWFSRQLESNRA